MIDITNCNKIIVDTIGKTEKIIEWYQQNKDWLDAEEFRIPIPSALVELPEEGMIRKLRKSKTLSFLPD